MRKLIPRLVGTFDEQIAQGHLHCRVNMKLGLLDRHHAPAWRHRADNDWQHLRDADTDIGRVESKAGSRLNELDFRTLRSLLEQIEKLRPVEIALNGVSEGVGIHLRQMPSLQSISGVQAILAGKPLTHLPVYQVQ
jgi:hypothetical protein